MSLRNSMKRKDEQWVDALKHSLGDYGESLPDNGWERLRQDMDLSALRRKRMVRVSWLVPSVAAAIAVVFFATRSISRQGAVNEPTVTIVQNYANVNVDMSVPAPQSLAAMEKRPAIAKVPVYDEVNSVNESNRKEQQKSEIDAEYKEKITVVEKKSDDSDTVTNWSELLAQAIAKEDAEDAKMRSKTSGKWAVGLRGMISGANADSWNHNLGGGYYSDNLVQGDAASAIINNQYSDPVPIDKIIGNTSIEGVNYLSYSNGTFFNNLDKYSYTHHLPISVGLSVNKYLTKRISAGTGVTYSLLVSDLTSSANTSVQKLHFIGIPLSASWDFYQGGSFNAYLNAGGMGEKCIYAELDGKKMQAINSIFWSLSGAVGIQYNFDKLAGIYLEAGGLYYFPNECKVTTIRSSNPLDVKLLAGVRFYIQ